jgi:torulene dioxygenase
MLQVCDSRTLEPKRLLTYADIDPELAGFGICAHPPKDRALGTTYNYIISKEGVLSIFSLDIKANPAKLVWKTAIPCPPCYIHSLAMTKNYVVFIRNVSNHCTLAIETCVDIILKPIHMNISDMRKQVMEMLEYEPGNTTKFFVLRKLDGKL